jgi:hypothetical protein
VIRFSAFLVVAAVGTLVAGVVTSKLLLVYIAIGVSGLALLALGAGAAVHWRELTGKPETAAAAGTGTQVPVSSPAPAVVPSQVAAPEPATAARVAPAATGTAASRPAWSGAVPATLSRPGYLPTEPPAAPRPPAPGEWKWRDDPAPVQAAAGQPATSPTDRGDSRSAVAGDQPPIPDDDVSVQDQTMIFRAQPDQTMIFRAQPAADAGPPPASTPPASIAEPEPSPAEPAAAAPEDTAVGVKTAAADTAGEAGTAAETTAPANDAEPAADASASASAAGTAPAAGTVPASGASTAVTAGATPEDDTPAKTDAGSAAETEPAAGTEPTDNAASAGNAAPSQDKAAPSEDKAAPSEDENDEPADDATTITKAAAPASGADPASDLEVTVVPGVPRYHKATCILIRFMGDSDLDKMTVAAAKDAGCTPCRACLPDQPEGSPE